MAINGVSPTGSLPFRGALSPEGLGQSNAAAGTPAQNDRKPSQAVPTGDTAAFSPESLAATKGGLAGQEQPSKEEQQQIRDLQSRDRTVRQHEQAHVSAGGSYVRGGANYQYTTGPDGKRYATDGEVQIEVGAASTPQATIRKMQVVERAALAPADPSSADRAVYASAVQTEQHAREQLSEQDPPTPASGQEAPAAQPAASGQPSPSVADASPAAPALADLGPPPLRANSPASQGRDPSQGPGVSPSPRAPTGGLTPPNPTGQSTGALSQAMPGAKSATTGLPPSSGAGAVPDGALKPKRDHGNVAQGPTIRRLDLRA